MGYVMIDWVKCDWAEYGCEAYRVTIGKYVGAVLKGLNNGPWMWTVHSISTHYEPRAGATVYDWYMDGENSYLTDAKDSAQFAIRGRVYDLNVGGVNA